MSLTAAVGHGLNQSTPVSACDAPQRFVLPKTSVSTPTMPCSFRALTVIAVPGVENLDTVTEKH